MKPSRLALVGLLALGVLTLAGTVTGATRPGTFGRQALTPDQQALGVSRPA